MNNLNNTIINLNKAINTSKLSAIRFWAIFFMWNYYINTLAGKGIVAHMQRLTTQLHICLQYGNNCAN